MTSAVNPPKTRITVDPKKLQKISELIENTKADPTNGIGLPKPLRYILEDAGPH
jgi:Txe/YoeB family toxin of Txe-Axe toxin-antitoxin module